MKIRHKINLAFLGVFVVVITIIGLTIRYVGSSEMERQAFSKINDVNAKKTEELRFFLSDEKELSSLITTSTIFRELLATSPISSLYKNRKTRAENQIKTIVDGQVGLLYLFDRSGKIVASSGTTTQEISSLQAKLFEKGKEGFILTDSGQPLNSGSNAYFFVASPIFDSTTKEFLGVAAYSAQTDHWPVIVDNTIFNTTTGENFLINDEKQFLTLPRFFSAGDPLKNKADEQNIDNCFLKKTNGAIVNYIDYRGESVIGAYSYIPETNWCLVTKIDREEALSSDVYITRFLILLCLVAIFVIALLSSFISRKTTNALELLQEAIKKVESGNLDSYVDISSKDELGSIAASFGNMTKALKEARGYIEEKVRQQTADITAKEKLLEDQQKDLVNALRDSVIKTNELAKFKLAVDNVSDMVLITDIEGILLYGNKSAESITGYSVGESLGKKSGTLWHSPMPKEYYEDLWRTIKTKKKTFRSELQNKRKNGEIYETEISISPVLDKSNNVLFFVGVERDITREKKIERSKSEFVSLASHQLRTPLSSINWYSEMLLGGDAGPLNEQQKKYMDEVYAASRRMVSLIGSLLSISHIELGGLSIEPEPVNVNDVSHSTLRELSSQTEKKKQRIIENYDMNIPIIPADVKMVRAIFQNLLSNAVKYTPNGGTISSKTLLVDDGKTISIEISDTGYGIPAEQQAQIFTKFFRADNAREEDTDGTGLGLYLVKMILEQIKGTVSFTSVQNKGTTFYVKFPVDAMASGKEGKPLS